MAFGVVFEERISKEKWWHKRTQTHSIHLAGQSTAASIGRSLRTFFFFRFRLIYFFLHLDPKWVCFGSFASMPTRLLSVHCAQIDVQRACVIAVHQHRPQLVVPLGALPSNITKRTKTKMRRKTTRSLRVLCANRTYIRHYVQVHRDFVFDCRLLIRLERIFAVN